MSNQESEVDSVRELLAEHEKWHVWMLDFGLTHAFMRLVLHTGSHLQHTLLHCSGCLRFEGDIQGGPYELEVRESVWCGHSAFELRDTAGAFRVVCSRIAIGDRERRGPAAARTSARTRRL
jgi:hypothetical protein